MSRILIPTDFSECAENAIENGLTIAKQLQADITFLHLIATPVEWNKLPLEKESLYPETKVAIGDATSRLNNLVRKAETLGVEACYSLVYNLGVENIPEYITKSEYKLVVMGTHGKKGDKNAMGSNTQKVIRNSSVPVLTIKTNQKIEKFEKIVIASDFHKKSEDAFYIMVNLALQLKFNIEILYVNVPYQFRESKDIDHTMVEFLKQFPDKPIKKFVVNAYNVPRGIDEFIQSSKPDIIGNITHGHTGLLNYFSPSITESVINHSLLPVLSINLKSPD
ncbi:MAG: universal stress protein [Gillisia sp.]